MQARSNLIRLAVVLLATAATAGGARASVDPALFQDPHWRPIGPFRCERVLAVAGAADDPRRV